MNILKFLWIYWKYKYNYLLFKLIKGLSSELTNEDTYLSRNEFMKKYQKCQDNLSKQRYYLKKCEFYLDYLNNFPNEVGE